MSPIAHGGKTLYGARVGVLMLDSRFPRIPGDMGNAATWPFPVLYKVVRGATPAKVVLEGSKGLDGAFFDAAAELVAEGADGITTTCGFLSIFQEELARHTGVPVAASTLMQVPLVERLLPPGKRVGIVTAHRPSLTPRHLEAVGVPLDTPLIGLEGRRELGRVLIGNEERLDVAAAELDMVDAVGDLVAAHPEVGAILFECANMAPYARAVRDRWGLPVFDIYGFVSWFHAALSPHDFLGELRGRDVWRER